jgi:antirestriction protein ArdC
MSSRTIYEAITQQVLERLDKGEIPWRKPWKGGGLGIPRKWDGTPYRGSNLFWLSLMDHKYPFYFGFKKLKELNGYIKKEEFLKHCWVTYWKITDEPAEEGKKGRRKFLLRSHKVWNYEQLEKIDLPEPLKILKEKVDTAEEVNEFTAIAEAEEKVTAYQDRPEVHFNGQRAYYAPLEDKINMPKKESFDNPQSYYAVLFHELVHSTGSVKRLEREGILKGFFGDAVYSTEELIAEFGATFLCGLCGIQRETLENSIAYIQGWSKKLKEKPAMLIHASQAASRAVDYMQGIRRENEPS